MGPDSLAPRRARFSLRLLLGLALGAAALGLAAITLEALFRARLTSPQDRQPTAFYTRPIPWRYGAEPRPPVALGTLKGTTVEQRIPVELGSLPNHLIQAVLAVEDQRFYRHHGLDLRRIGGALVANLKARGITQGGSTLTQQLAKNLFLSADRTPVRKLREVALALTLEARYDKRTILEAYLNEIYLGQDGPRGLHGVAAASRYYFGKEARKLSVAESALLAGMISAPNRYAPNRNPRAAEQRRDLVLQLMLEQRRISPAVADRAARAPISTRAHPLAALEGRWFRDYIMTGPPDRLTARPPARGLAIYTTIDASLQRAAERAVQDGLSRLGTPGLEAALLALDPRTGELLALIGGADYGTSQFNRATGARRQPGSAFKPVVALAALERSDGQEPAFTLASVLEDEPLRVRVPGGTWEPANYDRQFRGPVTLREAMEQSLNVPFARIGLSVGPDRMVAAARRLGITSPLRAVPSLALGSSEVSLLELVRAYGVLAAGGNLATTQAVIGSARYGEPVPDPMPPERNQVFDPAVAYLVTSTLEGVVSRGTGRALTASGRFEGMAGKTGTSNDWRDAWFLAYSPSLVVGAWVGFDDGRSLRMSGATAALPIVARFLAQAASDAELEPFAVPDGITEAYVGNGSGWFSDCGGRELFLAGTEPRESSCMPFEIPSWERLRDWGSQFKRRTAQVLEQLSAELQQLRRR